MLLPRIRSIKILFLTFLTISLSVSCSNSQTLRCTRVVDGDTIILSNGERVRLEYGWQERDKYGRLLAYVYLLDNTFLNAEIIK